MENETIKINKIEIKTDKISELINFISYSLKILRHYERKNDKIHVLLPVQYKIFIEYYFRMNPFFNYNFLSKEIFLEGIEIKFISPENCCYVFSEDYVYYENKENIYFKKELNY